MENPFRTKFTIPKIQKPNLTITRIVTPTKNNSPEKVTSPRKIVYPPLESDEDILEIDLQISESENSESESGTKTTLNAYPTENRSVTISRPIKSVFHSAGKSRLDPSIFEQNKRPSNKFHKNQAQGRKIPQGFKRPNPFVWSKTEPPAKRAPSSNVQRVNTEVVCPKPTETPPTIIINNYYRGVPYNPPHKPPPQCSDPKRMSRGQFRRFMNRKSTTQEQIKEALAIRNSLKNH